MAHNNAGPDETLSGGFSGRGFMNERVRIRSLVEGVDLYGRISQVEESSMEIEVYDRTNALISLGRGTDAHVTTFRAEQMMEFPARVIEDSGRTVRLSPPLCRKRP